MLTADVSLPSPEPSTLADLSRNASVISTSSSSDSLLLRTPRPRPIRTFSSPRSRSPRSSSPRNSQLPSYLTRDLGLTDVHKNAHAVEQKAAITKTRSKSRNPSLSGRLSTDDFKFGATLGEGSYSTVMRGTYLGTGQEYAIKVLDKGHLIRNNKMSTAHAEKNALVRLGAGHPGIVRLYWAFHDEWSLYFVLDLARNGEMQSRIARLGSLSTACTQYYAAQIVDAIDYMHAKGVIHRDLKPENLLLDDAFRIKITDFGTGKILEPGVDKAKTFVGTAQYVSPELLESNETSKSSDFWSLGCIIYQMIAGRFAFQGLSEYLTWQKIKQLEYTFPEGFDEQAKDLVQKLLVRNPAERLGAGVPGSAYDMHALRSHPFFAATRWETLWLDPAPPLEAGLVKKDRSLALGRDQHWEDVGAAWDDLVGNEGQDLDEVSWASDGEGPGFYPNQNRLRSGYGNGNGNVFSHDEEVGPMDEIPRYATRVFPEKMERVDETPATDPLEPLPIEGTKAMPILVPRDTSSTRSASSSDGSPIEKLGATLESLVMNRGRDRSMTPVQGNGPSTDVDLSSVLLPGELILFNSTVEARSLRRRASRLLPIPSPGKSKTRPLILTTQRLVCLKLQHKGRGITVKSEFTIRPLDKGKEKDSRSIVSVEHKGEREFVIMTLSKSHPYAAASAGLASTWIQKINEALNTYGPQAQKRRHA